MGAQDQQSRLADNQGMSFLLRLLINAAALWVATRLVPGVTFSGDWLPFLGVALVFGVVNAFVGPVAKILAIPLIILTLGIFLLVVNGLLLWLTSSLSSALGLGFHVSGFWAAFFGALVVSIVSTLLTIMVGGTSRYEVRVR
jgi:putative membrane protein